MAATYVYIPSTKEYIEDSREEATAVQAECLRKGLLVWIIYFN